MKKKIATSASEKRNAQKLVELVLIAGVESGAIHTEGKTDSELSDVFCEFIYGFVQSTGPITRQTDHTPDLLRRARNELKKGHFEYAVVFYATWIEHWVNWYVYCLARRHQLLESHQIKEMLREVNCRGKLTWLIPLLGGKQIAAKHQSAIQRLCDLRNSFIHYKYPEFDVDRTPEGEVKAEGIAIRFEETVRYLQARDRIVLKRRVRMKIKRFAQDKGLRNTKLVGRRG